MALRDLPDPVEDGSDLPGAQYARVSLHQWFVVVLGRQGTGSDFTGHRQLHRRYVHGKFKTIKAD